jgi:hypothetical protein
MVPAARRAAAARVRTDGCWHCATASIEPSRRGGDGSEPERVQKHVEAEPAGKLLPFPVRGGALLVRLADLLRARVNSPESEHDPLLLLMSRGPGSRLSIDRDAYVEFDSDRGAYQVAVEAAPDTRLTLQTTDFDTVVNFVVQYIDSRESRVLSLEAAS